MVKEGMVDKKKAYFRKINVKIRIIRKGRKRNKPAECITQATRSRRGTRSQAVLKRAGIKEPQICLEYGNVMCNGCWWK